MKKHLLRALRACGLLDAADRGHRLVRKALAWVPNRRFVAASPGYPVPPVDLAFEAYGHCSWEEYRRTGEAHARLIAGAIRGHARPGSLKIAEWGCGCGRILRHLDRSGLDACHIIGFDIDSGAISWSQANLPGVEFILSGPLPPLPLPDQSLDAVYHYSVWTHLPAASVDLWAGELARVLAPAGVLVATTHGDAYRHMLLPEELCVYDDGNPVSRANFPEGRKYFLSFHPAAYIETLLRKHFDVVFRMPPAPGLDQDIWVGIKGR